MVPEAPLEQTEQAAGGWDFVHCPPGTNSAGVEEDTNDADVAYARFPESVPTRYRDGLLPGD